MLIILGNQGLVKFDFMSTLWYNIDMQLAMFFGQYIERRNK